MYSVTKDKRLNTCPFNMIFNYDSKSKYKKETHTRKFILFNFMVFFLDI